MDEPAYETELAIAAATSCVCVPDEPVAVAAAATGMNSSGVCTPRVRLTDAGVAAAAALVSSDMSAGAESADVDDDTDDLRLDLFAGSRRRVSSTPTMVISEDCVSAVSPLELVSYAATRCDFRKRTALSALAARNSCCVCRQVNETHECKHSRF